MLALTLCACERFSMASGELNRSTVVKEILITAQSGARGTSDEKIRYYNRKPPVTHVLETRA